MIPKTYQENIVLPDGRKITIETGKLAKQAHGSVVVKMGKAMLLCTVVSNYESADVDFLPLTVDYREKFSSAGKFPGGFFKREARPSDNEILTMRIVDRVLRPLFPKDYHSEVQIMIQLISNDSDVMPDSLAGLAASCAIYLSDIPFESPISEVRVARIAQNLVINPSRDQLNESDIDLVVGASENSIIMVEGEMDECSEEDMIEAIMFAHESIKSQIKSQKKLLKAIGEKNTREYDKSEEDDKLLDLIEKKTSSEFYEIGKMGLKKEERSAKFSEVKTKLIDSFNEEEIELHGHLIKKYTDLSLKKSIRKLIIEEGIRLDGRKTDEIRPIWCEVDYLPSTHGSSVFTRGETQSLASLTLGTSKESNKIDLPSYEGEESFYLHYNFPPFSTGEARPLRGTSRREIGHGNLAQRSLKKLFQVIVLTPSELSAKFLESNGSSSMASVCSGTLALMDAGIKIKRPVSGIAMGLITDNEKYAVLSDILGDEDHLGDMDFKITGTSEGITSCQMDIKIKGLSYEILSKALNQAKIGRLKILDEMLKTISTPNNDVKAHAPKIIVRKIPNEFIGPFIGPGGKVIQELQKETECTIVINEDPETEEGIVEILGTNEVGIQKVLSKIDALTFKPEKNNIYSVKVIKILDFGAVVEYVDAPGNEVLLHISEIAWERTKNVTDEVNIGDIFDIKYFGFDPRTKKEKISRKALIEKNT